MQEAIDTFVFSTRHPLANPHIQSETIYKSTMITSCRDLIIRAVFAVSMGTVLMSHYMLWLRHQFLLSQLEHTETAMQRRHRIQNKLQHRHRHHRHHHENNNNLVAKDVEINLLPSSAMHATLKEFKRTGQLRAGDNVASIASQKEYLFIDDPGDGRPPYHTLIDEMGNVTGDTSKSLDYAIVGFGKCGTTTMMNWLGDHPDIEMWPRETYDLLRNKPAELLEKMYKLPVGPNIKRGYKSPTDLVSHTVAKTFATTFPHTKLIVGVRHPVLWFQSLYNFRVQNLSEEYNFTDLPHPKKLIGMPNNNCELNACTTKGFFGMFLRHLGKSGTMGNMTQFELRMHMAAGIQPHEDIPILPNPVFLFEVTQLQHVDEKDVVAANKKLILDAEKDGDNTELDADLNDRTEELWLLRQQFREDLENFLELKRPLDTTKQHAKPGRVWQRRRMQTIRDQHKIDICDPEYDEVRFDLMRMARLSSVWIRKYLLAGNLEEKGLYVSSPDYFRELIRGWMEDPCPNGREATSKAGFLPLYKLRIEDGINWYQ